MTRYTKEFREQTILLSDEIGVKKAAESTEPLTEREKQLMKEIAELKEANEILKDAMSFFVKAEENRSLQQV